MMVTTSMEDEVFIDNASELTISLVDRIAPLLTIMRMGMGKMLTPCEGGLCENDDDVDVGFEASDKVGCTVIGSVGEEHDFEDVVYGKHNLPYHSLMRLHRLSHVNLRFDEVRLYDVGSACRVRECSFILVGDECLKPIMVIDGRYVLLRHVATDLTRRTQAMLISGGMVPITMVAVDYTPEGQFMSEGVIGQVVTNALYNMRLTAFDICVTRDAGLAVRATGEVHSERWSETEYNGRPVRGKPGNNTLEYMPGKYYPECCERAY